MLLSHKALAEVIGTFAMIFIGGGSMILAERFPQIPGIFIPAAWGGIIALMILAVGNISGAHFNPAVTLAFAAFKRLPAEQIPVYWLSQFAGGLMAVTLLGVLKKI
ncbi:MAG: aquaporin [Candidatus Omnitrophica bacterium]|nr:aquaporin [Candidatus Omnitrophota bacterium]